MALAQAVGGASRLLSAVGILAAVAALSLWVGSLLETAQPADEMRWLRLTSVLIVLLVAIAFAPFHAARVAAALRRRRGEHVGLQWQTFFLAGPGRSSGGSSAEMHETVTAYRKGEHLAQRLCFAGQCLRFWAWSWLIIGPFAWLLGGRILFESLHSDPEAFNMLLAPALAFFCAAILLAIIGAHLDSAGRQIWKIAAEELEPQALPSLPSRAAGAASAAR